MASAPNRTSWVRHLPIPLKSSDPVGAHDELVDLLRTSGPDWFYITAVRPDGGRIGYASDLFRPQPPHSRDDIGQFLLFDIHLGLGGWWLSHLWRVADFAEATEVCVANWLVLPAAACARALLEGVAAFVVEGEELLAEWSVFKQHGVPELAELMAFRERFDKKLSQAMFGSRLGERSGTRPPPLKRTNVLTLLEKFSKRVGRDVWEPYEWLCDAVHPSFGFGTAYVATRGVHETGATMAADLARRTDKAVTYALKIEPTVAWAAADVLVLALRAFLAEVPRVRWLIDDLGLTTGVAFTALDLSLGRISRTTETANCPCGSGLSFRACTHTWGTHADPPSSLTRG